MIFKAIQLSVSSKRYRFIAGRSKKDYLFSDSLQEVFSWVASQARTDQCCGNSTRIRVDDNSPGRWHPIYDSQTGIDPIRKEK